MAIIAVPLSLAAKNPSLSARAYALTGATGVCIVCYVIPVVAHFKLLLWPESTQAGGEADIQESLLLIVDEDTTLLAQDAPARHKEMYSERPSTVGGWFVAVGVPLAVLLIGCSLSSLALWSSLVNGK